MSNDVVMALKRMWIDQPSTLQPLHSLHGTNVLAQPETDKVMRVYFLSGDVISQRVPNEALSPGWRTASNPTLTGWRADNLPPAPAVSTDDAIEQIVVGFSDKAILWLDIKEDDPRLSRVCDDMRQTVRAILSRFRVEDVLEEGNKRGLYDTTKIGPELVAFLDDRGGMLAALRDEMSEGYRGWLDDAVEALRIARDHLAALTTPVSEGSATEIAEKARSFARSKTKLLREVVESRRTTPAQAVSRDEIVAVLERCSQIVDRNLYHQSEKVEDVPVLLRRLAARLRGEG